MDFSFLEKPVLGKISLIRRAKSAVARSTSTKKTNDEHPLFHVAWEEKELRTKTAMGISNGAFVFDMSSVQGVPDEAPVTVEEVKRHMEQFHLRKCTPPHSAKIMDEKTGKYVKTRRTRTAKNK